jgi:hypothetical protein
MVKICQTGLLKLNFEIIPKKHIFRFWPKISTGHGWSLKIFFCHFPNPWTLRVSGMVGYTSKCEKKSKSLHPTVHRSPYRLWRSNSILNLCPENSNVCTVCTLWPASILWFPRWKWGRKYSTVSSKIGFTVFALTLNIKGERHFKRKPNFCEKKIHFWI